MLGWTCGIEGPVGETSLPGTDRAVITSKSAWDSLQYDRRRISRTNRELGTPAWKGGYADKEPLAWKGGHHKERLGPFSNVTGAASVGVTASWALRLGRVMLSSREVDPTGVKGLSVGV